jgi:excisionase family DNA binding protein
MAISLFSPTRRQFELSAPQQCNCYCRTHRQFGGPLQRAIRPAVWIGSLDFVSSLAQLGLPRGLARCANMCVRTHNRVAYWQAIHPLGSTPMTDQTTTMKDSAQTAKHASPSSLAAVNETQEPAQTHRSFTIGEVARHVGVSTRTVKRWIASGELVAHRFGRSGRTVRIAQANLIRFLEKHRSWRCHGPRQ